MKTGKHSVLPSTARLTLLLGLLTLMLGAQRAPVVHASTWTVCNSGCHYQTIQAAISAASDGDIISVLEPVHTEAGITVRKSLTIEGQGTNNTIVQAQTLPNIASTRVFAVNSDVTATIRNMTIRHGNVVASLARGGGIYNSGTLTLLQVTITENRSVGSSGTAGGDAYGGGIYNSGTLTVQSSTLRDNTVLGGSAGGGLGDAGDVYGGAIANEGALLVQGSTISANTALGGHATGLYGGGGDAYAGGIYSAGMLNVQDSSISANVNRGGNASGTEGYAGDAYGSGVALWETGTDTVLLTNSTISTNTAQGGSAQAVGVSAGSAYGGGVAQQRTSVVTLAFTNCTISGNLAQGGAGFDGGQGGTAEGGGVRGSAGLLLSYCTVVSNQVLGNNVSGGGLYSFLGGESGPTIQNCIIADNSGPLDARGPDLFDRVQSQDHNLIENPNGYTLGGIASNDIEGLDPLLEPLQDNGGPTQTHAPQSSSPIINQIPSGTNGCGTTATEDQRGVTRPQDGACEIGAVEVEKTGRLEVAKELLPDTDPGTFHLQIDGNTKKSDAGDGDSTGQQKVATGIHTVAEVAGTFTDLADYSSSIVCRNQGGAGSVVAEGQDAGPLAVTVNEGDDIVCTITNVRKTGFLEVVKDLEPDTDPGLFHLQIDGSVRRANASDGDSTGKQMVNGGAHTIGESPGTSTSLDGYNSSMACRDQGGTGSVVAEGQGSGPLVVTVGNDDDIVCTITNVRKSGFLEVVKDLQPDTDSGRFHLQIDGATVQANASDGGTTGRQTVNTGERTVGELAGTNTNLVNYNSDIVCRDQGGTGPVVAETQGPGPLALRVDEDDDIVCTITNVRRSGFLEVVKDLEPDTDPGLFHLQIDGTTRKRNASDGGTTGRRTVDMGEHTVGELAGTNTDLNHYASAIECRDQGGAGSVVADTLGAGPLSVMVNENDDIVCTIRNVRQTGFLEVVKALGPDTDPGRFHLQIDGATVRANASDGDSTGQRSVSTGEHTVGEIAGMNTDLADYGSRIECRNQDGTGSVVASGEHAGPLAVMVNKNDDIVCTISNGRRGTIIIAKQTDPAGGTGFAFADDIAPPYSFSLSDGQNKRFMDPGPGDYQVTEMAPAGWFPRHIDCVDPDGGTTVDRSAATAFIDLDPGEEIICTFMNAQMPDLSIAKSATPAIADPGHPVTYTLVYSNAGSKPAPGVIISDIVPSVLSDVHFESNRPITPTGTVNYTWQVGDLAPGEGGIIILTAVIHSDLVAGLTFTNTASMTSTAVAEWDPSNNSDSAAITIIGLAPLAVDDRYSTRRNTPLVSAPLSVLDNDSDPQGDPLTAWLDSEPAHGVVVLERDGTFVYLPPVDFVGEDTFTYHANDGFLDSNTATVRITVRGPGRTIYLPLVVRRWP